MQCGVDGTVTGVTNFLYKISIEDLFHSIANVFGFKQNHSTSHTLINLTETINRQLDGKKLVAGVIIDLEKALDSVNRSILSDKLKHYGFRGKINELILSFLSNRRQYVSINCYDSIKRPIQFGVPQGSTFRSTFVPVIHQ